MGNLTCLYKTVCYERYVCLYIPEDIVLCQCHFGSLHLVVFVILFCPFQFLSIFSDASFMDVSKDFLVFVLLYMTIHVMYLYQVCIVFLIVCGPGRTMTVAKKVLVLDQLIRNLYRI